MEEEKDNAGVNWLSRPERTQRTVPTRKVSVLFTYSTAQGAQSACRLLTGILAHQFHDPGPTIIASVLKADMKGCT
ncbi:hypothetical protein HYQ46_010907 [Verticillium longisporum]|nr:hypothetical protein HYQ46_010907 [Verticillium longisporum]